MGQPWAARVSRRRKQRWCALGLPGAVRRGARPHQGSYEQGCRRMAALSRTSSALPGTCATPSPAQHSLGDVLGKQAVVIRLQLRGNLQEMGGRVGEEEQG